MSRIRLFQKRGVALPHHKVTAKLQTVKMPLSKKLYIPLQQHTGAPCEPVVQKKDEVEKGQLLGKMSAAVCAPIYSPASGKVTGVTTVDLPGKFQVETLVIKTAEEQPEQTFSQPQVIDRESYLKAVEDSGVVGLGGAGFPTAAKLGRKKAGEIKLLLVNGAECEPYIATDDRTMIEEDEYVRAGVLATLDSMQIPRGVIAIEKNKPEAIMRMKQIFRDEPRMEVFVLPAKYPQGGKKILIQVVCGDEVPTSGSSSSLGVMVMNVTSLSVIGKYIETGEPLLTKRLTVAGGALKSPQNVEVAIGTPVEEVIEFCGGFTETPKKIVAGGPMMGHAIADLSMPVTKQINAILCLTAEEIQDSLEEPCIRCGKCIDACPLGLSPVEIVEAYDDRDVDALAALYAESCMNCGVCSFVCPAKRRLSTKTSQARKFYLSEVRKNGTK